MNDSHHSLSLFIFQTRCGENINCLIFLLASCLRLVQTRCWQLWLHSKSTDTLPVPLRTRWRRVQDLYLDPLTPHPGEFDCSTSMGSNWRIWIRSTGDKFNTSITHLSLEPIIQYMKQVPSFRDDLEYTFISLK